MPVEIFVANEPNTELENTTMEEPDQNPVDISPSIPTPEYNEVAKEPTKKAKKKRELTEEQREKLKEQLARGRETAKKNRQKKALVKKIKRKEKDEEDDRIIAEKVLKKETKNNEIDDLRTQLAELKKEFTSYRSTPKEKIREDLAIVSQTTPTSGAGHSQNNTEPKPAAVVETTKENVVMPPPREKVVYSTRKDRRNEFF